MIYCIGSAANRAAGCGKENFMYVQLENFGHSSSLKSLYCEGKYECAERIHQFPEMVCVLEGELEITVDGTATVAKAGDLAVITPFRRHSFSTPVSCNVWIGVISLDIAEDFIADGSMYANTSAAVFTPSRSLFEYVRDRLPERHERHVSLKDSKKEYRSIRALTYAIFEEYTRLVPQERAHVKGTSALASVLIYLSGHYTEDITLESVANALGYSPTHVSHCISVIPDMSFRGLINSMRTDKAKTLLLKSELRMIDISVECGFASERSFNRAFLAATGMTPSEYRKRNCL